jgi:hypothetical protein
MNIDRVGNTIRNKIISKSLVAFGFGQIQDAMNIITVLKGRDLSIDGFMEWGRWMQKPGNRSVHRQLSTVKTNKTYICPLCGLPLLLIPVNSMSCDQVGGVYHSLFYCYDELSCGYELYNEEIVEYWESLFNDIVDPFVQKKKPGCGKCGSK